MSDHDLKCAVLLLGMLLGTAGDGNREYDCLVNLEAEQLGPLAAEIAPLDYEIDPADAHQPGVKRRLLEGELLDETSFVYTGRRRATDGTWATEYDYRGRTTSMTSPEAARRIEFVYDPNPKVNVGARKLT